MYHHIRGERAQQLGLLAIIFVASYSNFHEEALLARGLFAYLSHFLSTGLGCCNRRSSIVFATWGNDFQEKVPYWLRTRAARFVRMQRYRFGERLRAQRRAQRDLGMEPHIARVRHTLTRGELFSPSSPALPLPSFLFTLLQLCYIIYVAFLWRPS